MGLPTVTAITGGGGTTEQNLRNALRDARYDANQALERILLATTTYNGSSSNGGNSNVGISTL